jgi:hypothetical protein
LLDPKTQERYYTKIIERYMTFCSDAGERDELLRRFGSLDLDETPRSTGSREPGPITIPPKDTKALSDVMQALRKLREGIVASKRVDDFAIQAYLFCIRLSVLVKHPESYHPAVLYVLKTLHPQQSLTRVELQEIVGYLVLDAACRRSDLSEAYDLRHRYRLQDSKIDAVLGALAHDNYYLFRKSQRSVDGHKAKLMEFAEPEMRIHTLKCFGRSYLTVEKEFLEKCTDSDWQTLKSKNGVGWDIDGQRVIIRKVKGR